MNKLSRFIIVLVFILQSTSLYSQESNESTVNEKIKQVEEYIIYNNLDSARIIINELHDSIIINKYKSLAFIIDGNPSYSDYHYLINTAFDQYGIPIIDIQKYFTNLFPPPQSDSIIMEYVYIKWKQISLFTNAVMLDEAEKEHKSLAKYINKFDKSDPNYQRAIFHLNIYPIILDIINNEVEKGEERCNRQKEIALALKDTALMIMTDYYRSSFLISKHDLEGYINLCESAHILDNKINNTSPVYIDNLCHLVDAYLYKGGNDDRIYNLLEEISNDRFSENISYNYYIRFVNSLSDESEKAQLIYKKFGVNGIVELCDTIISQTRDRVFPNDFYHILNGCARTLENRGYYKEAMHINNESVEVIKNIYTEELSNTLSRNKIKSIEEKKEIAIAAEKSKSKLYLYISILLIGLAIITITNIIIQRGKNNKLRYKNKQIAKQRDEIKERDAEKQLLLKEIHHRVKNNFQIISSLLELQTKGIEDEKALSLAKEGQGRVRSMALIHQKLYQNDDLLINFSEYIQSLVREINTVYSTTKIETIYKIDNDFTLDIDTAIPLGLIINELITNSFKYAFNQEKLNQLSIQLIREDDRNLIIIKDNGPGMKDRIKVKAVKSIGLKLVRNLVKQLHGRVEYSNNNGASFTIYFKETYQRNQIE
ncbi:MAG: hypothetical protein DRI86_03775 [Bacteroidetes bacterium]|nr:MAG: hypothetical protein DRI86_03775 [Bacteroidota bacterium]